MKNILLFGFITLLIVSCIPKNKEKLIKNQETNYADTVLFKDSIYLFFENLSDSTYRLIWGNNELKNTSIDTIHVFPNGKLNLEYFNSKAIIVRQGCGSSCFFAYVLPIFQNVKEKLYMYPLAFDTTNNLIAYGNDKNDLLLTIENYISYKKMNINEDFLKGPFSGFCIDSIFFQSNGLFIKWKNSDDELVTKLFDIKELK
ncbi:MAG: hypothetical protein WC389_21310 [Lutibacter sp.]|jgi:hypothetical protein